MTDVIYISVNIFKQKQNVLIHFPHLFLLHNRCEYLPYRAVFVPFHKLIQIGYYTCFVLIHVIHQHIQSYFIRIRNTPIPKLGYTIRD